MFYVIKESGMQVDDGPFETRDEAETWIEEKGSAGIRYNVLDEAQMDEMDEMDGS